MTWVKAKFIARHLRCLDWQARHSYWSSCKRYFIIKGRSAIEDKVRAIMGPDELLDGVYTGEKAYELVAIPLQDMTRKKVLKQTTLHRFFGVKKRWQPRQVTLHRYMR